MGKIKMKVTGNYLGCAAGRAQRVLVEHKICGMCREWGIRGSDNWTIDCGGGDSQIGPTMDTVAFVYPTSIGETKPSIERQRKRETEMGLKSQIAVP